MRSSNVTRGRICGLLVTAIGALALLALPGVAAAKDRNHDRIPDRWEKRHHLSLRVNQASRDQDRDHLDNRGEFQAGDNPQDRDSDNDGTMDGEENAGTIASFDPDTGKLVINLFGGDTVSGLVTDQTEIECEDAHSATASDSREGENNSDENETDGDNNHGDEPGDDHEGDDEGGNCTTADLVPGATVGEAELELEHGVATFGKVELAPSS